jgi:DNA-binding beta-propeller fold protein YncE
MQIDYVANQINYVASQHVRDVVASLGRTEDVRFSPSNRRLAVAGFLKDKITVFDVSIAISQNSKSITLTGAAEISSTYLKQPHGLDFIDDDKILVANRLGQVCIFELPLGATGSYELEPLAVIRSDDISTPGSVAVFRNERGAYEALICNNYVHRVTRHRLDLSAAYSTKNKVLLSKWLDIPDSICVSKDTQWIAVSNHNNHAVFLYENNPSLNASSSPDGILRSNYPHGVRFTSDGQFIFGASAGSPYVNIYEKGDAAWRGVRSPLMSFRVLNNENFLRGQDGRRGDGGAKGIDINNATNVLVTTCENQPLAFFDLAAILEGACSLQRKGKRVANSNHLPAKGWLRIQNVVQVSYELYLRQTTTTAVRWVLKKVPVLGWVQNRITGLS